MSAPWEKYGGQAEAPAEGPWTRYGAPEAPAEKPASFVEGFRQGLAKPLNNAARFIEEGAERIGIAEPINDLSRSLGMSGSVTEAEAAQKQAQDARGLRPTTGGKIAGSLTGAIPAMIATKNPYIGGAISGALETDARDALGVAKDAGIGAIASKLGQKTVDTLGGIISPRVAPVIKKLQAEGVKFTPGQIKGGWAQNLEDRLTSTPLLGPTIQAARDIGTETFNRAAINRVLRPLGMSLPKHEKVGHAGVAYAEEQVSDQYKQLLPKLAVQVDDAFAAGQQKLGEVAETLAPERAKQFENILRLKVWSKFTPDGAMTGKAMKEAESELSRLAREYGSSSDADQRALAAGLREAQAELRALVERSNPAARAQLGKLNEAWANLVRVQGAAGRVGAKEGVFTPAQLLSATRAADKSVRKSQFAKGGALMQDLAEAGKDRLSPTVGNSGTWDRASLPLMLTRPDLLAGSGVASLLYSRPSQAALSWAMTGRQGPTARAARGLFGRLRRPAAAISAVSAPQLVQGPLNQ